MHRFHRVVAVTLSLLAASCGAAEPTAWSARLHGTREERAAMRDELRAQADAVEELIERPQRVKHEHLRAAMKLLQSLKRYSEKSGDRCDEDGTECTDLGLRAKIALNKVLRAQGLWAGEGEYVGSSTIEKLRTCSEIRNHGSFASSSIEVPKVEYCLGGESGVAIEEAADALDAEAQWAAWSMPQKIAFVEKWKVLEGDALFAFFAGDLLEPYRAERSLHDAQAFADAHQAELPAVEAAAADYLKRSMTVSAAAMLIVESKIARTPERRERALEGARAVLRGLVDRLVPGLESGPPRVNIYFDERALCTNESKTPMRWNLIEYTKVWTGGSSAHLATSRAAGQAPVRIVLGAPRITLDPFNTQVRTTTTRYTPVTAANVAAVDARSALEAELGAIREQIALLEEDSKRRGKGDVAERPPTTSDYYTTHDRQIPGTPPAWGGAPDQDSGSYILRKGANDRRVAELRTREAEIQRALEKLPPSTTTTTTSTTTEHTKLVQSWSIEAARTVTIVGLGAPIFADAHAAEEYSGRTTSTMGAAAPTGATRDEAMARANALLEQQVCYWGTRGLYELTERNLDLTEPLIRAYVGGGPDADVEVAWTRFFFSTDMIVPPATGELGQKFFAVVGPPRKD